MQAGNDDKSKRERITLIHAGEIKKEAKMQEHQVHTQDEQDYKKL